MEYIEQNRRYFRVVLIEQLSCRAKLLQVNDTKVITGKYLNCLIINLSGGGARLKTPVDLPFTVSYILGFSFQIEGEYFSLQGMIRWKKKLDPDYYYGVEFVDILEHDRERLIQCLNAYEFKKARVITQSKSPKSPNTTAMGKIIEALPYPAYLIARNHTVVAANKAAMKFNLVFGEQCYLTIYGNKSICPFCKMELSSQDDGIVTAKNVLLHGKKFTANWLHIDGDLFLHYFKPAKSYTLRKRTALLQRTPANYTKSFR